MDTIKDSLHLGSPLKGPSPSIICCGCAVDQALRALKSFFFLCGGSNSGPLRAKVKNIAR
ncbi:Hypothetical protein FKW44_014417, partial [Caligus rogercresseyi]